MIIVIHVIFVKIVNIVQNVINQTINNLNNTCLKIYNLQKKNMNKELNKYMNET